MAARADLLASGAFVAFVLLGGANGTAIAFSNRELAPFWGAALRFVAATLVFLAFSLATRRAFPRGRALAGALLFGLLAYFGTYGLIYWAFQTVKPGLAQVILAIVPLVSLGLATVNGLESFRWNALAGGVVCLAGIAYIFQGALGVHVPLTGILALVGAAFCIAESGVVAKRFPRADWATTNAVALAPAGLLFLGLSFLLREPYNLPTKSTTWIALGYLIALGSVAAFALYLFVLRHWPVSRAAYQWVLLPLVALPLSASLTGEQLSATLAVGALLVLAGVYVGAFWRRGGPTPAP